MDFVISTKKGEIRTRLTKISLLEYAKSNRKEGEFNDVKIAINDDVIPANRMVLSYSSTFFEKMFKTDMKKSGKNVVYLRNLEAKAVTKIIEYFYSGIIEINNKNVLQLLAAAHHLQVDEVKDFCSEFLQQVIIADTCANILATSRLYKLDALQKGAFQFIIDNSNAVTDKHCVNLLPNDDFVALIAQLDRSKTKETAVYRALVDWVKHKEKERSEIFPNLLNKLINFEKLPTEFLQSAVAKEKLVTQNSACLKTMMDVSIQLLNEKRILGAKKSKIISFGGRKSPSVVVDVFSLGDSLAQYPSLPVDSGKMICDNSTNCFYCFSSSAAWNGEYKLDEVPFRLKAIDKPVGFCQAAIHNSMLVVVVNQKSISRLQCYIFEFCSWIDGPPMRQTVSNSCELLSCNGSLYALGGMANSNCSSNVERLPSLSFQLYNYFCETTCLTEKKRNASFAFRTAEINTNPTTTPSIRFYGQWETTQHMQIPRNRFSAVSCSGRIYAIGGQTHASSATKSVERFDPTSNSWTYVSEMKHPRSDHAACLMDGKIYVVGGKDNDGEAVTAVECYDPSDDNWTIVGNLDRELCGHSLITA